MNAPPAPQTFRQLATVAELPLTAVEPEGAETAEATKAAYTLAQGWQPCEVTRLV